MPDEAGRAQDQGRRHRRKGSPSAETSSLLAEYQAAMRRDLRAVLDELRGPLPSPGLGLVDQPDRVLPKLDVWTRQWDLAMKLGRELGTEVDGSVATDTAQPAAIGRPRRRGRVDFG